MEGGRGGHVEGIGEGTEGIVQCFKGFPKGEEKCNREVWLSVLCVLKMLREDGREMESLYVSLLPREATIYPELGAGEGVCDMQ